MATQTGYKASELGMIPQDWEVVELGEVCNYIGSGTTSTKGAGNFLLYGSTGIIGTCEYAKYAGDAILVARVGANAGQVSSVSGRYGVSDNTIIIQVKSPINYFFIKNILQFRNLNTLIFGSGQPLITGTQLKNFKIAIPKSTAEQTAIATALSDTDALISSLQTLIAKKKAIKLSAMQNLLSGKIRLPEFAQRTDGSPKTTRQTELGLLPEDWEIRRVGDFTDCTAGGTPSTQVSSYWGGEIPWMSSGELHLKQVYNVAGRITQKGLENSSTKFVPANSVLIGLAGQGKTRRTVAISKISLCTNQSIAAIFPTDEFNSTFLFYNLENRYDELRALSTGDGGRGGLNLTIIRNVLVKFPSLPEQTAIAQLLSDMDAEIEALECHLKKTQALKQGMMQALLTGKIRLPLE